MRFNLFRSWEMSGPWGLDGLSRNMPKEMIGGCVWDYGARHHPLKILNRWLSIVLVCPKGASPLKRLGWLEFVPSKIQAPNPERGLASPSQLKSFSPVKPLSQPRTDSAYDHVVCPWELGLGWLWVRLRLSLNSKV